jgi:ketosteroid isomerase-like protein
VGRSWATAQIFRPAVYAGPGGRYRAASIAAFARISGPARDFEGDHRMTTENAVREASKGFYAALNAVLSGNAGPMDECWVPSESVSSMHPIGGRETGWEAVRASFAGFAGVSTAGHVALEDQLIQVSGDMAYELGTERGESTMAGKTVAIHQRVTNVYRHEAGAWKLVHHHGDLSQEMVDVLATLKK